MILGEEPIGDQVKQWRINLGLSQAELCRRSGVGADALSRLEAGKSTNPTWLLVEKLFKGMAAQIEVKMSSDPVAPQQQQLPLPPPVARSKPDNRLHADA